MVELLGWITAICSIVKSIPQAWMSYKDGHSRGLSTSSLIIWMIGLTCGTFYIQHKDAAPLLINYLINSVCCVIMIKHKYWERNS